MSRAELEPDLGYVYYPYESLDRPGHSRLDIILRKTPTKRHFDPIKLVLQAATPTADDIHQICVEHPWFYEKNIHVCAGRIFLSDRRGKVVEAFSFGGNLQIQSDADQTICVLESSAPIFSYHLPCNLSTWISAEAEIILARQKAHWDPLHPHEFGAHLASLDPFLLYASCLQEIQNRPHSPYGEVEDLDHQGEHFVQTEIKRLKESDRWPETVPTPDQLFKL